MNVDMIINIDARYKHKLVSIISDLWILVYKYHEEKQFEKKTRPNQADLGFYEWIHDINTFYV